MQIEVDDAFKQALKTVQKYAKPASLYLNQRPQGAYMASSVYVINDGRQYVTPSTVRRDSFNPEPTTHISKIVMKGWNLTTNGFFVTQRGNVMRKWYRGYASTVSMRNLETAVLLITPDEISDLAREIKDLARFSWARSMS